jgi:hypothetical protein
VQGRGRKKGIPGPEPVAKVVTTTVLATVLAVAVIVVVATPVQVENRTRRKHCKENGICCTKIIVNMVIPSAATIAWTGQHCHVMTTTTQVQTKIFMQWKCKPEQF